MLLQSCYAVFATSLLNCVSFHCFLARVELENELIAAWNQILWPCKGTEAKQQSATWMEFLTMQEKILS